MILRFNTNYLFAFKRIVVKRFYKKYKFYNVFGDIFKSIVNNHCYNNLKIN